MSTVHVVAPGEHFVGIAWEAGFRDWHHVWDHPRNAALGQRRSGPDDLVPGDEVFLPDFQTQQVPRATDATHVFVFTAARLRLRLQLEAAYFGPLADASCTVALPGGSTLEAADGAVDDRVPPDIAQATLSVLLPSGGAADALALDARLRVGVLESADQRPGQVARLHNLGYYRAAPDPVDEAEWTSALEEFQCEQGLPFDPDCGPQTWTRLVQAHGC